MKNKTPLILAGLGLVGFGVWEYMKKRNQDTTTTITIDTGTGLPVSTNNQTSSTVVTPDTSTQQSSAGRPFAPSGNTSASNPIGTDNSPITSGVQSVVMNWVNADGTPPIVAMGQARIPSEYNGMYAIIQGGWNPTPDQRTFWNQLVAKYDPTHKYL